SSSLGNTNITLQFTLDRNIDAAAQDVQAAISKTLRQLPTGIVPPSYQKVNPADQPIIYYALSSKTLSLPELDEYAETFIAQRLSMVDGVAQVNVFGAAKYAVRIQLDPKALATRSIGIDEVADGVAAGRVRSVMQNLKQQLPGSVDLQLRSDRSESIRASLHDVQFTLFLTLALVVLVIFLFLRNLSATIIPSLALPFSLVGTFAVMYALDYSLDNLSMMALTLSVGL